MRYTKDLESKSGKQISILVFESSKQPKATLIESHGGFLGNKEKVAEENKQLIAFAQSHDVNYISIDLSLNGSQKNKSFEQLRFTDRIKDVETVIDYVEKSYKSLIILIGSSLGGAITLNTGKYSEKIVGMILNCPAVKPHVSLELTMDNKEFRNWKRKGIALWGGIPFPYDFYLDLKSLDATKILSELKIPILWFHGTNDTTVPIIQAHEAKSTKSDIELIEVNGGGHRFGDKMRLGEWEHKVETFILGLI